MSAPSMVKPFRKPRRVDAVKRAAAGVRGDCFAYAFQEAMRYIDAGEPAPEMIIVHGAVRGGLAHAWVERGGFAYDWQTFAVNGAEPCALEVFRQQHKPRDETRYQPRGAVALAARSGHAGPWTDQ